jgi:hypothetical protein
MVYALSCRYSQRAFLYAVPIGGLAGLVGLGGGEFRLPVLTQVIGFSSRAAIPLNLLISLAALSFALATRSHAIPVSDVIAHWPEVAGLTLGGTVSAILGARVVLALSERRLTMVTAMLIAAGLAVARRSGYPVRKRSVRYRRVAYSSPRGAVGRSWRRCRKQYARCSGRRVAHSGSHVSVRCRHQGRRQRQPSYLAGDCSHRRVALSSGGRPADDRRPEANCHFHERGLANRCSFGWHGGGRGACHISQGCVGSGAHLCCDQDCRAHRWVNRLRAC